MYPRLFLFIVILLFPFCVLHAQTFYGQHEVSVSFGYLPLQQRVNSNLFGVYGGSGGTYLRDNTGMGMFNYKYYMGGCTSAGISVGMNKFATVYDDYGQILNKSDYTCVTVAAEFTFNYKNRKYFRSYGYVGAGLSVLNEVRTEYRISGNHTFSKQGNNFDFQFVPLGISLGNKLAFFLEVGIGYKGLVNTGMSYRFDTRKPVPASGYAEHKKAVVVHGNYDVDDRWKYLGEIKSGKPKYDRDLSLEHQYDRLAVAAARKGANVIMLKRLLGWYCNNCFWLKADMWSAPDPDSFKMAIEHYRKVDFGDTGCAYVIVYRKDAKTNFKEKKGFLDIGSKRYEIKDSSKYIFKVPHEGWITLSIPGQLRKAVRIDVKVQKGKKYYFSGEMQLYGFKAKLVLKEVKERVGEIESNNHTTVYRADL